MRALSIIQDLSKITGLELKLCKCTIYTTNPGHLDQLSKMKLEHKNLAGLSIVNSLDTATNAEKAQAGPNALKVPIGGIDHAILHLEKKLAQLAPNYRELNGLSKTAPHESFTLLSNTSRVQKVEYLLRTTPPLHVAEFISKHD